MSISNFLTTVVGKSAAQVERSGLGELDEIRRTFPEEIWHPEGRPPRHYSSSYLLATKGEWSPTHLRSADLWLKHQNKLRTAVKGPPAEVAKVHAALDEIGAAAQRLNESQKAAQTKIRLAPRYDRHTQAYRNLRRAWVHFGARLKVFTSAASVVSEAPKGVTPPMTLFNGARDLVAGQFVADSSFLRLSVTPTQPKSFDSVFYLNRLTPGRTTWPDRLRIPRPKDLVLPESGGIVRSKTLKHIDTTLKAEIAFVDKVMKTRGTGTQEGQALLAHLKALSTEYSAAYKAFDAASIDKTGAATKAAAPRLVAAYRQVHGAKQKLWLSTWLSGVVPHGTKAEWRVFRGAWSMMHTGRLVAVAGVILAGIWLSSSYFRTQQPAQV